jgi:hypothetical protein
MKHVFGARKLFAEVGTFEFFQTNGTGANNKFIIKKLLFNPTNKFIGMFELKDI